MSLAGRSAPRRRQQGLTPLGLKAYSLRTPSPGDLAAMHSGRRTSLVAFSLVLLALAGCSGDVLRPQVQDIRLSVTATPQVADPSHPVALTATVVNAGPLTMWHCEGCGCGNGIGMGVLGPDGQ